jgi:hypothetical protein
MYDTVNSWINRAEVGNLNTSALCLTDAKETANKDTGEVWTTGNLDNMKVTVSTAGISIKGSLAKFFLPDNSYTLNRKQVKEAVEKLSDTLKVNIAQAKITRIDVSTNFIMQHEVHQYYNVLGLCTHFNRVQATEDTLYYHSKGRDRKRSMVFYNKAREISDRNGIIPDVFKGENLLRYESRWNTRLPQQLKENEVNGSTLYNERFYSKIIDNWADNYFRIEKQRNINMDAMNKIKTVSDASDFICAIGLQRLKPDEVQNILQDMKQQNVFQDSKYYTRLKNKLKDISAKTNLTEVSYLSRELDNEIRNVQSYKR